MIEIKDIINYSIGTRFLIRYIPYGNQDFWEFEITDKEGRNFKYRNYNSQSEFWKNIDDLVDEFKYKSVKEIIIREHKSIDFEKVDKQRKDNCINSALMKVIDTHEEDEAWEHLQGENKKEVDDTKFGFLQDIENNIKQDSKLDELNKYLSEPYLITVYGHNGVYEKTINELIKKCLKQKDDEINDWRIDSTDKIVKIRLLENEIEKLKKHPIKIDDDLTTFILDKIIELLDRNMLDNDEIKQANRLKQQLGIKN
jgi:hypothetical protein